MQQIYPWTAWLDGGTHVLTRGVDFEGDPAIFQKQVQRAIRELKQREPDDRKVAGLRTRRRGNIITILHQQRRSSAYPWDEWLDGEVHVLRRGPDYDFNVPHPNFIIQARRAARERGLRVKTRTRGNEWFREVAIRAVPRPASSVDA